MPYMNKQAAFSKHEICWCPSFRMEISFCCSYLWYFLLSSWVDQDSWFLRSICCHLFIKMLHTILVLRSLGDGGHACLLGRVPPCLAPIEILCAIVSLQGWAGLQCHWEGSSWPIVANWNGAPKKWDSISFIKSAANNYFLN